MKRRAIFRGMIFFVMALLLLVVGYVLFLVFEYGRIEDNLELTVVSNSLEEIEIEKTYQIMTYNIGVGAYDREFSFFMDKGEMLDGKKTSGRYARATSKDSVEQDLDGVGAIINAYSADFFLFQEVDKDGTRSHKVDQIAFLTDRLGGYDRVFAVNFDTPYLLYPFSHPIGKSYSGLLTLSNQKITTAIRHSLPVDNHLVWRMFDLDRALLESRLKLSNGKELVIVNCHLSAYDEGGVIKSAQMKYLNEYIDKELVSGNYLIIGGDFNQIINQNGVSFPSEQKTPNWVKLFENDLLPSHVSVISGSEATCRSADTPYRAGINYTVIIDGFIVSDNIIVEGIETINRLDGSDISYQFSDHNPVKMTFRLKE